jgi:DNA polymerase-3 subunit alpha
MNFNPIYWNTACLIVNSGATSEDAGGSTDYGKIAKAIGDIMNVGIKVSLANINKSMFGFAPDVENNEILFGLKGMLNVGDELIAKIIENRPYSSIKDFYNRIHPSKQSMISLIKGGAFDELEDRKFAMAWYIWETCDKKKRITLQNMNGLIKYNLLAQDTEEQIMAKRVYEFNRYLKSVCDKTYEPGYYVMDERTIAFLQELGCDDLMTTNNTYWLLNAKEWDKIYQSWMNIFRNWIAKDKDKILLELNSTIFQEDWEKYASGSISAWEMEALCFYYHEHELQNVDTYRYGIVDFFSLPEEPEVDKTFTRGNKEIKMFKLHRICGTCIAKNKTKGTATLLTTTGVVDVKFRKEYFSLFDKQISVKNPDGTKKIVEKSWFNRGNMVIVTGVRMGDNFVAKKYASTPGHQLYRISELLPCGELKLQEERYQGGIAEDVEI